MGIIKYKGESYGGGGGTNVVANPSGTATGTLNKLQVGDDIYNVGGGSGNSYSTTEQVVGTWIDGRPLYQKTFYVPEAWQSTSGIILDSGFVPSVYDQYFMTDVHMMVNNDYMNGNGQFGGAGMEIYYRESSGLGYINASDSVSISDLYLTIRYTKVADIQE